MNEWNWIKYRDALGEKRWGEVSSHFSLARLHDVWVRGGRGEVVVVVVVELAAAETSPDLPTVVTNSSSISRFFFLHRWATTFATPTTARSQVLLANSTMAEKSRTNENFLSSSLCVGFHTQIVLPPPLFDPTFFVVHLLARAREISTCA